MRFHFFRIDCARYRLKPGPGHFVVPESTGDGAHAAKTLTNLIFTCKVVYHHITLDVQVVAQGRRVSVLDIDVNGTSRQLPYAFSA